MGRWLTPALGLILALASITPDRAWAAELAPPSDRLADAVMIPGVTTPGFGLTTTTDMTGSTYLHANEPAACGTNPTRTVWYRFTADMSGTVTISTAGSDAGGAAVRFHQYRASLGGLYSYPCPTGSTLAVNVVATGEYWIQLSADDTGTNVVLALSFSSIPPNDRFTTARGMTGVWFSDAIDISRATSDVGEPVSACGGSGRTVWYRHPATTDASISIDPSASTTAGTMFTAYRSIAPGFGGLDVVACSRGPLTFNVRVGEVYYIQASDTGEPGGTLAFSWSFGPPADLIPPFISDTPSNMLLTTPDSEGRLVTYPLPTAIDDVSGVVGVTCSPASGSLFPVGDTYVVCRAHDAAGNLASTGFWVSIDPEVAVPAGIPISSYDVRATPLSGLCGWNHHYDGTIVLTGGGIQNGCYWRPIGDYSGGGGTLTDGSSTGKSDAQLLTSNTDVVSGQRLRPAITLHLDSTYRVSSLAVYGGATTELESGLLYAVTVEIGGVSARIITQPFGPASLFGPTNDLIDLSGTALGAIPTSTIVLRDFQAMLPWGDEYNTFAISEITAAGAPATDLTPPDLTIPTDLTAEATGPTGAAVSFDASAVDAVDGSVAVTCAPASGSTFTIGVTSVTCSASDASGNRATRSFAVTVRDTLAPTVTYGVHPTTYVLTDSIHITCTATDAVGVVSSTCSDVDGFGWSFALGGQTLGAIASDEAGNVASTSTTFTVVATYGSVVDLTRAWSSKAGLAKDLVAILDSAAAAQNAGRAQAEAGKLADYRSAVLAQAGKAFTLDQARMLAAFTYGL